MVSRYLDGKAIPDRETIKVIAKDANVDPGWLDYGTKPAKPSTHVPPEADAAEGNG